MYKALPNGNKDSKTVIVQIDTVTIERQYV